MTATVFDSFHKTNQTLSGGNLTTTSTGAGWVGSSRSGQDDFYAEFTLTTLTGIPQLGIAVLFAGSNSNPQTINSGLAYDPSGAVKYNSTTLSTIAAYAAGARVDMAVSLRMKLIWFRVSGGNWNNNALNDPATYTGGIDYSGMAVMGSMQALVYASVSGTVWTAAFSAGSWAGTAPVGYGSLDNINPLAIAADLKTMVPPNVPADAVGSNGLFVAQPLPQRGSYKYFQPSGSITMVSGTVMELGVTQPNKRVDVYDPITGELLGSALSASDGTWSIPCLGRPNVRVVADDPTTYNSLVYDNVIPF